MIITITNIKERVGSVTITTNLAVMRAEKKQYILLINANNKNDLNEFSSKRIESNLKTKVMYTSLFNKTIWEQLRLLRFKSDDIFVCVDYKDKVAFENTLLGTNLLIIPLVADQINDKSLLNLNQDIGKIKEQNEELKAFAFLNKVKGNEELLQNDFKKFFSKMDHIEFFENDIKESSLFRRSFAEGKSIFEIKSNKNDPALKDMKVLYNHIFR